MSTSAGSSGKLLKRVWGSNEGPVGFSYHGTAGVLGRCSEGSPVPQHWAEAVSHILLQVLSGTEIIEPLLIAAFAGRHCPLRLNSNISLNSARNTFPAL